MSMVVAFSNCCACGNTFKFHPNLVPSLRMTDGLPDPNGQRTPVCKNCVIAANERRAKTGHALIPILPGAYEEADEHSIDWNDNRTLKGGTH